MPLKPGDSLGPYEILASLGAGGMGEVYRARDGGLHRDVALKLLPSGGDKARFQAEARALAALNHPNIVAIYDVGDEYLVTELVDGAPLKATGVRSAIDLCSQVADGLGAAHSVGIFHRDLKPANILVTREGRVKIIDFGLAKRSGVGAEDETKTEVGTVLGTAAYMAPEQVRGQELDARSDLFSLGSILYEQVGGVRPFGGETVAQVMTAILEKEPGDLPERVPSGLKQIIYRCLAKDREQRFQTARDLAFALRTGGSSAHPTIAPPRRVGWVWPVVAAMLAVSLLVVSFWRKPATAGKPIRFTVPAPEGKSFGGLANGPALLSPDGTLLLVPLSDAEGNNELWLRPLDSVEMRKLEGTKGASHPFWSPDSTQIAFFANGKLQKRAVSGGTALPVCDAESGRGGDWSAVGGEQGTIVFAPANSGPLMQVPAAGGPPKAVTALDASKKERSHRFPMFIGGGKRFLYLTLTPGQSPPVVTGSLDGEPARELMTSDSRVVYAPPAPGETLGRLLYVRDGVLLSQPFDPDGARLSGEPVALASGVEVWGGRQMSDHSVSGTGVLAYRAGKSTARLVLLDRLGKPVRTISEPAANLMHVRISPSGKQAAYSRETGTNLDVWVADLERAVSSRLTSQPFAEMSPVWSSDTSRLVYTTTRDLFMKRADGSGSVTPVAVEQKVSNLFPSDWSTDGRFLFVSAQWKASFINIGVVRMKDGMMFPLFPSEFGQGAARISPGGKWLAYSANESGTLEVYVRPLEATGDVPKVGAGKWRISKGGYSPMWRADGKELAYLRPDGTVMSVAVRDGATFEFDPPKELFRTRAQWIDMTPDGTRFVAAVPEHRREDEPLTVVVNWWGAFGK